MPETTQVAIEGLEQLMAKLSIPKFVGALKATLWATAEILRGAVATYPPESEANQPREAGTVFSRGTGRALNQWYVRGRGTVTTSGRMYLTSEDLGHSWTINVQGLTAEIGSGVSYGPYVQGARQVGYHRARGWKTIFTVVKEQAETVTKMFRVVVDRLLT